MAQIDYARQDTHYLFALRDLLEQELHEQRRWELAQDDFTLACDVNEPKEKLNGSSWKKFVSRKDVTPRELTILSELCICRDSIAEKMDRPAFKVIPDGMLLDIARNLPEKDVDLAAVGLSPRQIRLWGSDILRATRRGLSAPLVKWEQAKRPSEAVIRRLEKLKAWRKKLAAEINVESDIILPKMYLNRLADNPPKDLKELQAVMGESPTRFDKFGEQIYDLIGG